MGAKKPGFDRFVHKKESGAKLKEKIRQEKKKAREEKNAFFEEKKLERKKYRTQDSAAPQRPFQSKKSENFRNAEDERGSYGRNNTGRSYKKDDQRGSDRPFGRKQEDRPYKKSNSSRGYNSDNRERSNDRSGRPAFKKDGPSRFDRDDRRTNDRGGSSDRPSRPAFKKEGPSHFDRDDRRTNDRGGSSDRPSRPAFKKEGGSRFDRDDRRTNDRGGSNDRPSRPAFKKEGPSHFDKNDRRSNDRGGSNDRPSRPAFKKEGGSNFDRDDKKGGYTDRSNDRGGRSSYSKEGSSFKRNDRRDVNKDRSFGRDKNDRGFKGKSNRFEKSYDDRKRENHRESSYDAKSKDSIVEAPHLKAKPINEPIPLNKFLAHAGVSSRREAADIVKEGKVSVNDQIILEPGFKVTEKDEIKFNGKKLHARKNLVYILLNKPKDYITTTDDPQGRKTVLDIVKNATEERIYPIGRLDRNTTGVLLLTNDGELSQKLSHPSYEVKKIYEVRLDKDLTKTDFDKLAGGITLEDGFIQPDAVGYPDSKDKSIIGIEIHSGKNRIVRRIFEALGYDVRNLDRVMYADLTKKNVDRGKWRFLSEKEVRILKFLNKSYSKNKTTRG